MKKLRTLVTGITVCLITITMLFLNTGCETGTAECEIVAFEGHFAGIFVIGGFIPIPTEDTVIVVVDVTNNRIRITSKFLGITFDTDYDPSSGRSIIGSLSIDVLEVGEDQLTDITIAGGHLEMAKDCSELFIELNQVSVQDHTIDGLPAPILDLDVSTPGNMRKVN